MEVKERTASYFLQISILHTHYSLSLNLLNSSNVRLGNKLGRKHTEFSFFFRKSVKVEKKKTHGNTLNTFL